MASKMDNLKKIAAETSEAIRTHLGADVEITYFGDDQFSVFSVSEADYRKATAYLRSISGLVVTEEAVYDDEYTEETEYYGYFKDTR